MHEAGDAKRDDQRLHILGHCLELVFRVQFSLVSLVEFSSFSFTSSYSWPLPGVQGFGFRV